MDAGAPQLRFQSRVGATVAKTRRQYDAPAKRWVLLE
jgi:hypothetical protein